jgi:hypothetical protein
MKCDAGVTKLKFGQFLGGDIKGQVTIVDEIRLLPSYIAQLPPQKASKTNNFHDTVSDCCFGELASS